MKKTGAILFAIVFLFCLFFVRMYRINGRISLEMGNIKDSSVIIESTRFAKHAVPFLRPADYAQKNGKIGWVTDIHADRFKRRSVDSGTLYPRQYADYLPEIFDELSNQGIETVLATGDNTNSGDDNYAQELAKIAQRKHMNVIWVRGNHDNDEVMKTLGVNKDGYYYVDYGNSRIIVLNDVKEEAGYLGGIDEKQLNWLKDVVKTEKPVIVAMHIPMFFNDELLAQYQELENILKDSGNVKLILSGHLHVPWQKEFQGLKFFGQAALTREEYKGAYGVIDLQDDSLQYLFAKLNL
jgi:predicted phosphodiesterase